MAGKKRPAAPKRTKPPANSSSSTAPEPPKPTTPTPSPAERRLMQWLWEKGERSMTGR